jgi:hypothetical protein
VFQLRNRARFGNVFINIALMPHTFRMRYLDCHLAMPFVIIAQINGSEGTAPKNIAQAIPAEFFGGFEI